MIWSSASLNAETPAHVYTATDNNAEITVVLNKGDLFPADPEWVKLRVDDLIDIDASESVLI
jgi:translation elongation factor EF-4